MKSLSYDDVITRGPSPKDFTEIWTNIATLYSRIEIQTILVINKKPIEWHDEFTTSSSYKSFQPYRNSSRYYCMYYCKYV